MNARKFFLGTDADAPLAAFLLAPAAAILCAFGIGPMIYAVYLSLHNVQGRANTYIGLANYHEAFTGDAFWNAVEVTVYYALGAVPATIVIGFILAYWLHRLPGTQRALRTIFFLPYITSVVAAAMIWRMFFEPQFGLANHVLTALGLEPQRWLLEPRGVLNLLTNGAIDPNVGPSLALCAVIVFEIWRNAGFVTVLFLAALANVPRELEDAARLDGASSPRVIASVVLPLVSPTLFFVAVISFIGAFQAFGNLYALTGDGRGPLDTTQNLTVYIFTTFYERGRLGYGSAIAVILCATLAALTALQWRIAGRRVFYQ